MTRTAALCVVLIVAGVPFWVEPSPPVATASAVVALVCGAGVLRSSVTAVKYGAVLALLNFAWALWWAKPATAFAPAAVLGLGLLVLFDSVTFGTGFKGIRVAAPVLRSVLRYWVARAAIIVIATAILTIVGSVAALGAPSGAGPVLTAGGALLAGLAGLAAARRRRF